MGKKYLLSILGALLFSGSVYAQTKIAYVDSEKILAEYEDAKIARASLDNSIRQWKHELDSMRLALQTTEDEFKAQQPMLSGDALRARQLEIEKMRKKYDDFAQNIWGDKGKVAAKNKELFDPVLDKINKTIEELAADKDIGLVLDLAQGSIMYAEEGMDMTQDVLTELNREYASVASSVKRKAAVLSVYPLVPKAQFNNLNTTVRGAVLDAVKSFVSEYNLEVISEADIALILQNHNSNLSSKLDSATVVAAGQNLNADFAFTGSVTWESGRIAYTLDLYNTKSGEKLWTLSEDIDEKEEKDLAGRAKGLAAQMIRSRMAPATK
ncbi:OmpH family outer membrane protein [bacterium]|nr:OmpH family outer membrane protein [bacterium]